MTLARAIRQSLLVAVAACLTACTHTLGVPRPAPTVRVMTYNIQAGGADLLGIAEVIRASSADIVALQEVDVHWHARSAFADQAAELAAHLGLQVRFAPIYNSPSGDATKPPRQYGVALLSRFPILSFTNHEITRLSTQSEAVAPTAMPGFLEAVLEVHGVRLRVFNTHLDYRGDPTVRRRQVTESLAIIGDASLPTLMFGDLNATPSAPELQPLFSRLRDGWTGVLDSGFTYPAASPVRRIDYVLMSRHFQVIDASVPDVRAADHRPVVMNLALTRTQ